MMESVAKLCTVCKLLGHKAHTHYILHSKCFNGYYSIFVEPSTNNESCLCADRRLCYGRTPKNSSAMHIAHRIFFRTPPKHFVLKMHRNQFAFDRARCTNTLPSTIFSKQKFQFTILSGAGAPISSYGFIGRDLVASFVQRDAP